MIFVGFLVCASALAVPLLWLRSRRHAHQLRTSPLAGLDTGIRSPYRVPGGSVWGPRRGF